MKLISLKLSPFVQRVAAMLEAKHLSYELEYIDFRDTPSWFLAISPHKQVPVLITDSGTPLFESEAIIEYLDEVAAPLEPKLTAEQRAIDRAWGYLAASLYLPQCSAMRSHTKALLESRTQALVVGFSKVEQVLGDGPYFKGNYLSNLDIAWLPLLHRAAVLARHTGHDLLDGLPKMKALQGVLIDSGLSGKSVAGDFDEVFTGFYLSDKTFLGSGIDHRQDATLEGSGCGG